MNVKEKKGIRLLHKCISIGYKIYKDPKKRIRYYRKRLRECGVYVMKEKNAIIKRQDINIKNEFDTKEKNLIVFLVPGWDGVNGGVMSICSIAKVTASIKSVHKAEVIIATLPGHDVFSKYSKFSNSFNIYRFEQILDYFTSLESILFHIPENFVRDYMNNITHKQQGKLDRIKKVDINILNQNIWYMPDVGIVDKLKEKANNITITTAHKKYCTRELRDKYRVPIHQFSTSNLTKYNYLPYRKKENLLLLSIDDHPLKEAIISKIHKAFPKLKIKQIENMSYEEYKNWLTRAKWMITFGEGIDGYFCESIRCGAIPFAAYNLEFFSETYDNLFNIYDSYEDMLENIVHDIKSLDQEQMFTPKSLELIDIDKKEYDDNAYRRNIQLYYEEKYTLPYDEILEERKNRIKSEPLISIVMATYNGEKYIKEQLESIKNLTYKNTELIISDDGSTDRTIKIIKEFSKEYKLTLLKNNNKKGVNGNFENGLQYAKGEYVALCDQDDIWLPNKLEILLENIDDYDIIHSAVQLIDSKGNKHPNETLNIEYGIDHTDKVNFIDFITAGWVLGCTSLIKTELVKKSMPYDDNIFFHDWWMTFVAIKRGNGVKYISTPTIKYRQHDNNTAQGAFKEISWMEKKIKFNNLLASEFEDVLTRVEKLALRNNSYYCGGRYFMLADTVKEYGVVDKFLLENKELFTKEFMRKFVGLVAEEVIREYALNIRKVTIKERIRQRIRNPISNGDKLLRAVYMHTIKRILVEPYRKIKVMIMEA